MKFCVGMAIGLISLIVSAAVAAESQLPPGIVVEIDDCGDVSNKDYRFHRYPRFKVSIDEDCDVSGDDANRMLLATAASAVRESCGLPGIQLDVDLKQKTSQRWTTRMNSFGSFARGLVDTSGNVTRYHNHYAAWVKNNDIELLAAFARKHRIKRAVGAQDLQTNAFLYEGEMIVIHSTLDTMLSKSIALFTDRFVVTGVPTTLFSSSYNWVIAGRGLGKQKVPGPYGQEVALPALAFVDAMQTPQAKHLWLAIEEVVSPRHKCYAEPLTVIRKSGAAPAASPLAGSSQSPSVPSETTTGFTERAVGVSESAQGLEQRLTEYLQRQPSAPTVPDQVLIDEKARVTLAYPADFELSRGQGSVIAMLLAPSVAQEKTRAKISVTSSPTPFLNKNPSLESVVASTIAGIRSSIPGAVISRPLETTMAGARAQVVMVQGVEEGVTRQKLVTMAVANQRILGVVLHTTPESFGLYADAYRRVCDSYAIR